MKDASFEHVLLDELLDVRGRVLHLATFHDVAHHLVGH